MRQRRRSSLRSWLQTRLETGLRTGLRGGLLTGLVVGLLLAAFGRVGASGKLAVSGTPTVDGGTRESASLLVVPEQGVLLSANFDAGSLSELDLKTGERLRELALGGDIRRLARSADGRRILASDYLGDRLQLIDVPRFRILRTLEGVGRRPFGIVFDAATSRFWVSLFESAEIIAVDPEGAVVERIATRDTPRGLALTRDGRLLVTHAMIGEVTIYDVRRTPAAEINHLRLAARSDPDEFASQGVPRLLDDIAISPDQREAWLPHVLWNFDHPFQFRSTVFPAISVLSLEPGNERELPDRRKELFRQIDVVDGANKTRIVSNPHDAAFSESGKKVYVTFSASEDLGVFDLSRRASPEAKRRGRRRGKQSQGGAQAVQILRHLPGDNPRGLALTGDRIFVQNAMTHDVSELDSGGDGPFARVRIERPAFARTVASDPLSGELRRGKRIFLSGNTDEFPEAPLAGDFWMSCASCHLDGFNFTNRYLMQDAAAMGTRETGAAEHGHRKLATLVAGDFVGDYIRMIQETQGGMGADERTTLERVPPDSPTPEVRSRMEDLHAYVTAPENLPLLSTWLRVEPASPVGGASASVGAPLPASEWDNPAACAECHSDLFRQWANSNHRLMASSHPYYRYLEDLAAAEEGEEFRRWCMGCHNPKQLLAGRADSHGPSQLRDVDGASLQQALSSRGDALDEGTDCTFCHRVSRIEHAGGNAGLSVNLAERERYPFESSRNGWLRWFGERLVASRPGVHAKSYLRSSYRDARFCGACHSEFAPGSGALISDTYGEWAASPFNAPDDPGQHRTCIDCHMHGDVTRIGEPVPGVATDGGRTRPNLRVHRFSGAHFDFVGLRDPQAASESIALLERAARISAEIEPGALRVTVKNAGAGHHLPTGVSDLRQFWLHARVTDVKGRVVLETGALDAAGRLPEDARIFNKVLGDAAGQPVGLRFWRYATLLSDTRIPAGEERVESFSLPPDPEFPLEIEVTLRYRSFPRAVTERVRERFPDTPIPEAISIARYHTKVRGF